VGYNVGDRVGSLEKIKTLPKKIICDDELTVFFSILGSDAYKIRRNNSCY